MENYIDDRNIHDGHRARMRAKLLEHGQRIFDTYELLEMLLYNVVPYKDTNPIAKRLLCAFGGLDGVFKASKEELMTVNGVGERTADFLISVGKLSYIIGAELLPKNPTDFKDYDSVGRFLVRFFSEVGEQCVVAFYLDNDMNLIEMKIMQKLDYESGGVKAKDFIDAAIRNHASVVISAHNHPHGPFYPTEGDRATNHAITEALELIGLMHVEHYIVCGDSYAGIGSLKYFTKGFSQAPAINDFIDSRDRAAGSIRVGALDFDIQSSKELLENRYNRRDFDYFASILSPATGDDGKEVAQSLLSAYRTIENTVCASVEKLKSLSNEKVAFLVKLLGYITSRRGTDSFTFGERHNKAEIAEYFKAVFLGESVEKVYILTFDSSDRITGCRLLGEGTVNASEVLPRKLIEAATLASARSVAIAHNHPFGNPTPSREDVQFTCMISMLLSSCGISLAGHYVVAGQRCIIVPYSNTNVESKNDRMS